MDTYEQKVLLFKEIQDLDKDIVRLVFVEQDLAEQIQKAKKKREELSARLSKLEIELLNLG
jgi:predicted  nucleic acid-binding Zn-ribbon protein